MRESITAGEAHFRRPAHSREMAVARACSKPIATLLVACSLLGAPTPALAQEPIDWQGIGEEAVSLLRRYLRVDTVNPPGNESRAAEFFARLFEAEGIPYELWEAVPGRANLIARLRGDGSRGGAIVLLNHTDVVPADPAQWRADPFGAEILDGRLYGRGVTDMKAYGIVQFLALAVLHRARVPLGRDVIFMATAGEETGGHEGAGAIVAQRPDLLRDIQYVLTEGGATQRIGARTVHFVEVTQKTPLWLRLRARGVAGHGSTAIADSAANRLIAALERVRVWQPQLRLVPPVAEALRAAAEVVADPELAEAMRRIDEAVHERSLLERLRQHYGNLLRSTVAITVLRGSSKTNVISAEAVAELDCRLLPGEDADLFLATLRDVIADPSIEIETFLRFEPAESSRDTPLWRAIEEAARLQDPDAAVVPTVLAGFTDSHYFRERGITAYGWSPLVTDADDGPAHGVDERLSVAAVRAAPRLLFDVVTLLSGPRPVTTGRADAQRGR